MNTVGIICELNPPHLGHKLLFDFTRETLGDCPVVAVMSGNYVQRGEPAVFKKHSRTAAALAAGADLVLELPVPYAVSSAERFASAAVAILKATGVVDTLAFGCECGDMNGIKEAADALSTEECQERTREGLSLGLSYAAARQRALRDMIGDGASVLESPNNLLGIEYLRAVSEQGFGADCICMTRRPGITASGLRRQIYEGAQTPDMLPAGTITYTQPVFLSGLEDAMLSRLRMLPEERFFKVPGAADGIAQRAVKCCRTEGSVAEVAAAIKTKRHTMSRVKRYLLCLALGVMDELPLLPPYIRVLGTNTVGRRLLSDMIPSLPVITKPADGRRLGGEIAEVLELEASSTDFYNLAFSDSEMRRGGEEWRVSPVTVF